MKILQVVEQAFRTLAEEQDDTILWLSQSMLGAGAEMEVLLAGNCAYYAVIKQRQPALKLGNWQQTEPAELYRDIGNILAKGAPVYVLSEDLAERGLSGMPVHEGVTVINRQQLPAIYERADQVWQW
jgi:sulfur relay (sulfurtransferase) DsrF/TusC family protein